VEAIDFRNGIDGLVGLCRNRLCQDPFSGALILFRNRRGTSIKILVYDGQGFWLLQKRLSKGRFRWWPSPGRPLFPLSIHELYVFLGNGDPEQAKIQKNFKEMLWPV
jgi:transposase